MPSPPAVRLADRLPDGVNVGGLIDWLLIDVGDDLHAGGFIADRLRAPSEGVQRGRMALQAAEGGNLVLPV